MFPKLNANKSLSRWAQDFRVLVAIGIAGMLASSVGCIRKRLTVRTNPPGAMVYVDKQPIGLTPVSTSVVYYGTRNIETVRDGYRTEKFLRRFNPPWYAIPPLDFFSESLWPFELKDERIVDVQLTPEPVVPNDALIASAEQLRLQASQGVAVAPPPTIGPMQPITIPTTPNSSVPFSTTPSPSNQVYPNLPATSQPFNPNPPILGPVYP